MRKKKEPMKKFGILFILFNLTIVVYSQNKSLGNWGYSAYGEWFNRVVNGKKEGVWIDRKNNIAEVGIYKNNKRDSIWQTYNITTGELIKEKNYSTIKYRMIHAKFGGKSKDTLVHILFDIYDKSVNKNYGTVKSNPKLDGVAISIVNQDDSTDRNFKIYNNFITVPKYKTYLVKLSKKGYITKNITIKTDLPLNPVKEKIDTTSLQFIDLYMSNRVSESDPTLLNKVSNTYVFKETNNDLQLVPDAWYMALQKRKLSQMDEYLKKQKIVEIENSVNEQILNLKEEQIILENQKKLKEAELLHQEEEIKRKQLEIELFAKNKIVSDLSMKAKEAELIKNKMVADEKKKEIESLNQQKIINELNIKNKENELIQKNIEAVNRQKQIKGLENEKELSNKNLKQQTFIRNLVLFGAGLLTLFLVFVFISLSKSRKANKIIALQKTEVEEQKHLVEEKQKEIVDSISYAKRLQEAILPPKEFVNGHLKDNFIFYQPKDIVAGDFYWAEKVEEKFFIAAADSTGHGVPGAMVSVVCSNALNRTIKEFKLTETGKILDKTRDLVKKCGLTSKHLQ
jgi:hypothetical protein